MLHLTHVAKCHTLHAVTSLHRGIKDSIGKCHQVTFFSERLTRRVPLSREMVRVFAHGAMGRRIDPSCGEPIELFLVPASAPRLV